MQHDRRRCTTSADYRGQLCVGVSEVLSRRHVSLGKTKAVRTTHIISSAHSQGNRRQRHHCPQVSRLRMGNTRVTFRVKSYAGFRKV